MKQSLFTLVAMAVFAFQASAKDRKPSSRPIDDTNGTVASIRCEVHEGTKENQVVIINPDESFADSGAKSVKFSGNREIKLSTLRKFVSYDTYPNVIVTGIQNSKEIFFSLFVGANDEYGMFLFGPESDPTHISGRCDVEKWKAFGT